MKKLLSLLTVLLVSGVFSVAKDLDFDGPVSDVKVIVTKAENGKPVRNAAVILHIVGKDGKQSRRGFEVKTNGEGIAILALPYGVFRVQVIASGFQTYGEDHKIEKATHEIQIKLNPPQEQHSIYK